MFEDSFLANLAVFLAGQIAGVGYLRTGLIARGMAVVVPSWVLADAALLSRFAYESETAFRASLSGMQLVCAGALMLFVSGRLRRRLPSLAAERSGLLRRAFVAYLRNDLDEARTGYRRLVSRDPWDLEARLGLATVLARAGRARRARAAFRVARSLDRERRWEDVIRDELARLARARENG